MRGRPRRIDRAGIDWSRPTGEIARELGIPLSSVSRIRAEEAPETVWKRGRMRVDSIDFSDVDWETERDNKKIAARKGCTPSNVWQVRRRRAPHTIRKYRTDKNYSVGRRAYNNTRLADPLYSRWRFSPVPGGGCRLKEDVVVEFRRPRGLSGAMAYGTEMWGKVVATPEVDGRSTKDRNEKE